MTNLVKKLPLYKLTTLFTDDTSTDATFNGPRDGQSFRIIGTEYDIENLNEHANGDDKYIIAPGDTFLLTHGPLAGHLVCRTGDLYDLTVPRDWVDLGKFHGDSSLLKIAEAAFTDQETGASGTDVTMTVTTGDNTPVVTVFKVYNGKPGEPGEPGKDLTAIPKPPVIYVSGDMVEIKIMSSDVSGRTAVSWFNPQVFERVQIRHAPDDVSASLFTKYGMTVSLADVGMAANQLDQEVTAIVQAEEWYDTRAIIPGAAVLDLEFNIPGASRKDAGEYPVKFEYRGAYTVEDGTTEYTEVKTFTITVKLSAA